jgi:endoglucanase
VLLGQRLKIKTSKGLIPGVVGFDPTSQYGQPKGLVEEDLWIDICACSQDEAESMVEIGDLGVIDGGLAPFKDGFLCGSGLDDRIGIFILNECMKWYSDRDIPVNLHFIATAQEEVGLRGGTVVASGHEYDACIVLDVDYATDTLVPHDNQMGVLKLGCGLGMQVKADNNPVLRRLVVEAAKEMGVGYQISVGRFLYGGTDSSPIQVTGSGVATLNLNIPCRYMHSPIEICSMKDVESAVNLLIGAISAIGNRDSGTFIPGID